MDWISAAVLVVFAGLVAAVVLVALAYVGELTIIRARVANGARLAGTTAGLVEYAERGIGFPLLSIHGAGGGYDQGFDNVAAFVSEGFRVIAPSRFGYLGTPVPSDASVDAQADAHASLLDFLHIERAIVVGTSAGARSAAALAIRHPERVAALVLIVPGTYAPTSPVMIEESRASALVFRLVNSGADFMWWLLEKCAPSVLVRFLGVSPGLLIAAPETERRRIRGIVRSVQPLSRRMSGINIDSHPDGARPAFERIAAPTLVISARDDLFNTRPAAEFAAGSIPGAKLIIHETGGHLLVGRTNEVRRAIRSFLAEQVPGSNS